MTLGVAFETEEWRRFSVPHVLCLVGEHQYLLDTGSISVAVDLRLSVEVRDAEGQFSVSFDGAGSGPEVQELAERWAAVLGELTVPEPSVLGGRAVRLCFDERLSACPPGVLLTSPAVAAALTVAVLSQTGALAGLANAEVADLACRVLQAVRASNEDPGRFYSSVLLCLGGGAAYVEPGEEPMNVQPLLPPDSLLVALLPGAQASTRGSDCDREVRQALSSALREKENILEGDDAGLTALFELGPDVVEEGQVTMLYGLMRVRQMLDALLEYLGEPLADNDLLAETCDEESAILADYFGFPAEPYRALRTRAAEAGALGSKLTWLLGGYPASIIFAPGRRDEVCAALAKHFPDAALTAADVDPAGLRWEGGEEDPAPL